MRNIKWTLNEELKLTQLINSGEFPLWKIAELMNRTYHSCDGKAREMKLESKYQFRIYSKNENFFDIPNIYNCHIGGFIAADGCLNSVGNSSRLDIELSIEDLLYLEKIKEIVKYNGVIYQRTRDWKIKTRKGVTKEFYEGTSTMVCLSINTSQNWNEQLFKNWNLIPAKSLILQPPNNLDKLDLFLAYSQGLLEGDGYITFSNRRKYCDLNICFLGTQSLLSWLKIKMAEIMPYFHIFIPVQREGEKFLHIK